MIMKRLMLLCLPVLLLIAGCTLFQPSCDHHDQTIKKVPNMEHTLAIIKPDAVRAHNSGKIIDRIEQEGFEIVGMKKINLSLAQAQSFYAVHKERPFFGELVEFMTSGPVVVMALAKDNAVKAWRDLMGATNPAQAADNTIRKLYGASVGENATHGSDAPETAAEEVKFFFPELS